MKDSASMAPQQKFSFRMFALVSVAVSISLILYISSMRQKYWHAQELFQPQRVSPQGPGASGFTFDDLEVGDGDALAEFCNATGRPWNPDLIFECPLLEGGVGNVRQFGLTCLRHALGARGSFIIPRLARRNAADISDFRTRDIVPFSYMFDLAHLRGALQKHCPQLVLREHNDVEAITNLTTLALQPVRDLALDTAVMRPYMAEELVLEPAQFPPALDAWLRERLPEQPVATASSPIRIVFSNFQVMWSLRLAADPPALVRQVSSTFRMRPAAYRLAQRAMRSLETRFGVQATRPCSSGRELEVRKGFVGVHLRVESDVNNLNYASYELQENYIAGRLAAGDLLGVSPDDMVVYVASGSRNGTVRLQADLRRALAPRNITVVTKDDLLAPIHEDDEAEGLGHELLGALSWDIQGLVDLLVLEHGAAHVIGVRESSFSWTVALARAAARNTVVGGYPPQCWRSVPDSDGASVGRQIRLGCEGELGPQEMWRDEWSSLVGDKGKQVNLMPWMWDSVFP